MSSVLHKPLSHKAFDWIDYFHQQAQKQGMPPLLSEFYQAGTLQPQTPLDEVEFLAMDFETTGLDVERDSILSIGVVPFTLNRIRYSQSRHWLIQPHRDLQDETVVIHGITHSDVCDADPIRGVLSELFPLMHKRIIVVHYKHIERSFLNKASSQLFGETCLFPLIDTMAVEKRLCLRSWSAKVRAALGMTPDSVRLANSRERYHLPVYPAHHALTDALATAELLVAQLNHTNGTGLPVSRLWE